MRKIILSANLEDLSEEDREEKIYSEKKRKINLIFRRKRMKIPAKTVIFDPKESKALHLTLDREKLLVVQVSFSTNIYSELPNFNAKGKD